MNITIEERGAETIREMEAQASAVDQAWKNHKPEWVMETSISLARQFTRMMYAGFGDCKVFRDGELSLLVTTESIVFGVIFFPKPYQVPEPLAGDIDMGYGAARRGRYCMTNLDTDGYCATPYTRVAGNDGGAPGCKCILPTPCAMPLPGEWSFHS